ncbi:hypothetical protein MMA231_00984 [Asticcacaulis sp. MM231]|uniref:baseplate J/gp47 family protein n=1 Tax=Asticcacaulis sp. MM231 TaxID=3157666 RepID=UPI0032D59044
MSDFTRPTLSQLIEQARNDLKGRLQGADSFLARSVVGALAVVWAAIAHGLYGFIDWLSRELMPDTAEAWRLRHASIWKLTQIAASSASGNVTVSGSAGKTIDAGTVLQRSDGATFTTKAAVTLTGATGTVAVTAVTPGAAGNTPTGSTLSFISPVSGISSEATVASGGITAGADIESLDALKARTLERIRVTPQGGSNADYKLWTKEIVGDTRVWVYNAWMGLGSVGVTFVMDGRSDIIPTEDEVQAVQDYLDEVAPVGARIYVFATIADAFNPSIRITPSTTAVKAAVLAQLTDYLRTKAVPGGTETLSQINEAISLAEGETDHDLIAPVAAVTHSASHIAVMGDITWVA